MVTYTAKLSGYQAAAAAVTWTSGGLASLASNTYSGLSDEIDNTTKYTHVDLYLELGSAAFTGAGSGIEIYLVPSIDGANYPSWTGAVSTDETENAPHFVGFMATTASNAAQKMILRDVELPPGKYKWAVRNRGGVGLNATGNALYWRPHGYVSTDA